MEHSSPQTTSLHPDLTCVATSSFLMLDLKPAIYTSFPESLFAGFLRWRLWPLGVHCSACLATISSQRVQASSVVLLFTGLPLSLASVFFYILLFLYGLVYFTNTYWWQSVDDLSLSVTVRWSVTQMDKVRPLLHQSWIFSLWLPLITIKFRTEAMSRINIESCMQCGNQTNSRITSPKLLPDSEVA